jgi:hypothetical protein
MTTTELDLVRDFMAGLDASESELGQARSVLDAAIALENGRGPGGHDRPVAPRPRRRSRRSFRWGIAATVVAAACVVAIFAAVPSAKMPTSEAAAAEIARLAETVQPVPPLAEGQWYQYELQGELSAHVTSGTNAAPVTSTADIPISIGEWANSTTAVCSSQQFGTVTFDDPADAQAWQTLGLTTTPANQPATGCSAGYEASLGGGGTPVGPIDVSNITHDPATLADQLQRGSTGISKIDGYATGQPARVVGFLRLTDLLVGPVEGQWSGFGQEMLDTLSLLPGIVSLGTMTSHSGMSGPAFSMPKQVTLNPTNGAQTYTFTPPTVILDPQDGDLLEVRNLDISVLQSAAQDFVGNANALVYADGVSYGTTALWIDPVSGLQVIGQAALPSWMTTFHIIEAVTSSTAQQSVSAVINPYLGHGGSAYSGSVAGSDQTIYDITILGSEAEVQSAVAALTTSGLFSSVSVKL